MEFLILGPLEVRDEDGTVALGGIKSRAVLAILLLHANEPVSAERLSFALWGDDAPASAVKTVQAYVSRLRKALRDAEALVATPAGYRLRVGEDELDAERFARRVEEARRALGTGRRRVRGGRRAPSAGAVAGAAVRGSRVRAVRATRVARLQEQRSAAVELRIEADLATGHHLACVGELRRAVAADPGRERLVELLMLALYRSGAKRRRSRCITRRGVRCSSTSASSRAAGCAGSGGHPAPGRRA